jgi:peptidyl-prolyl cis-trans isomerase A (cyclophilin A)
LRNTGKGLGKATVQTDFAIGCGMTRISLALALASAALALPAIAQSAPPPAAAAEAPKDDLVPVAFETSLGRIVIALDRGRAPVTTANFLRYVDAKRFDGESFYRAMKVGEAGGLIQGGIRTDSRKLFPPIAHEPTSKTGLKHVAGAVALANAGAGTARADFFILTTDIPGFDAGASAGEGFAVFGHVVEGMDVVKAIQASPVSATKGDGPMKGQMLEPPVKITRAARVKSN